jgi:hypothetical protein
VSSHHSLRSNLFGRSLAEAVLLSWVFRALDGHGVTGFNLGSIVVAVADTNSGGRHRPERLIAYAAFARVVSCASSSVLGLLVGFERGSSRAELRIKANSEVT